VLAWELTLPIVIIDANRDPKNKGLELAKAAIRVAQLRLPELQLHVLSNVEPERMPFYYRAADILLVTSHQEGSPNVVKEALACNLPVVSVPVGDVREQLASVQPSAVVRRNATSIAKAMVEILQTRKRSNGRDRIAHLALDKVAQRILQVYRDAAENRRSSQPKRATHNVNANRLN
jgi:glycosyltransferase involved in cell wall biosynthesis